MLGWRSIRAIINCKSCVWDGQRMIGLHTHHSDWHTWDTLYPTLCRLDRQPPSFSTRSEPAGQCVAASADHWQLLSVSFPRSITGIWYEPSSLENTFDIQGWLGLFGAWEGERQDQDMFGRIVSCLWSVNVNATACISRYGISLQWLSSWYKHVLNSLVGILLGWFRIRARESAVHFSHRKHPSLLQCCPAGDQR
jgi:hypothetical protein